MTDALFSIFFVHLIYIFTWSFWMVLHVHEESFLHSVVTPEFCTLFIQMMPDNKIHFYAEKMLPFLFHCYLIWHSWSSRFWNTCSLWGIPTGSPLVVLSQCEELSNFPGLAKISWCWDSMCPLLEMEVWSDWCTYNKDQPIFSAWSWQSYESSWYWLPPGF